MVREKNILKNYIIYILFGILICIVGSSGVFALTYTNIGEMRDITVVLVSSDASGNNAPINVPVNATYNLYDVFQVDYIINNYNFEANKNYQLESHLPNQVFTNVNYYSVTGSSGESCLISYENSILNNNNYPRWAFQCPRATNSITITIKNSSNEYLWPHKDTNIFTWQTALLKYSDTSLSGSGSDTDNIINNNNQNTQSIINNNTQNTQDIINNANKNTKELQDTLNSQLGNKCSNLFNKNDITTGYTFNNSGTTSLLNNSFIGNSYILVESGSNITISIGTETNYTSEIDYRLIINEYDSDKNWLKRNLILSRQATITLNSNTKYIKIGASTITKDELMVNYGSIKPYCEFGSFISKLDDTNKSINNLDNTLKDDDIDTSSATDFFDNFNDNTHGLSGVISAPLNAIYSMLNNQCTPLSATWKGKTISFQCGYSFWQRLTGFQTFLNVALDGLLCYRILAKLFKLIEKLKNPNDDRVEVMDL